MKSSMEPDQQTMSQSHVQTMADAHGVGANPGSSEDLIAFEDHEDHEHPAQPASTEKQVHKPAPLDLRSVSPQKADDSLEPTASSAATLKPTTPITTTATQYLNAESKTYVDPTPATPGVSQPPSRTPSTSSERPRLSLESLQGRSDDERRFNTSEDEREPDGGEIQNIMSQFKEGGSGPGEQEVMSPRLEIASPFATAAMSLPPRNSSTDALGPSLSTQMSGLQLDTEYPPSVSSKGKDLDDQGPPVPPKDASIHSSRTSQLMRDERETMGSPLSPTVSLHRPPPPEPEPESALPFDFHRFLEQLRNKKADPVAKYLRSFLNEFGKRQWMVHEQVKIISDFLAFIANKMALCDVWKDVSDAEFDNAREGMEKLVMNRLYSQTFSPAIPPPQPIPGSKSRRKGADRPMGPGRRGQHQEDVERDEVVAQKIKIYGWVREEHLDIAPTPGESGKRFLRLAQQGQLPLVTRSMYMAQLTVFQNCSKSNLIGHRGIRSSAF